MESIIVEYLNFVGMGLYLASSVIFLLLFLRTLRTTDGIGLVFLKMLTGLLSIGSFSVFTIRIMSEYGSMPFLTARAIAIVNPVSLIVVALYLNYLFHNPEHILKSVDSKNIEKIKSDVKEIKKDVKDVKEGI